jgi:putative ABC transport system permease protein
LRTLLTLLGVTTGVTLVVAIAVINTTLLTTVEDTARTLGGSADIEVAAPDSTGLRAEAVESIARVDGVDVAVPVVRSYTRLRGPGDAGRVLILGTTYDFHRLFHREILEEGSLQITAQSMSLDGVFLSSDSARDLGVAAGDSIEAETPSGTVEVKMVGSFSGPLVDALETGDIGIMPLPSAQEAFERVDRVDSVYVVAEKGADVSTVQSEISDVVGPTAIVGRPGLRASGFEETLNGLAALSSLAGTVALFVSAFVVFNTMSMSVVERRREISLTLALGANRRQVIAGFVGEAAVLGLIASGVGIVCGSLLAKVMVQPGLDGLRVFSITAVAEASLEWSHVLLGVVSGLGVSMIAAYLPARRIMKVAPVEALRPQSAYQPQPDGSDRGIGLPRLIVGGVMVALGIVVAPMVQSQMDTLDDAALITNAALLNMLIGCTLLLPAAVRIAVFLLKWAIRRVAGVSARLAVDSLRREPGRTTVTVGALVFTLGIVIGVGGALDSYKAEWFRSARAWYGGPVHVTSPSFVSLGSDQPLPPELQRSLGSVAGVDGVHPARYRIVNIDGRQTTIYVVPYVEQMTDSGLPSYGRGFRNRVASHLADGRIVISALASEQKGLGVGDTLKVPSPTGEASFEIGAVASDLNPLDSMYLSNEMFLEHWQAPAVDRFELTLDPGTRADEVMASVDAIAEREGIPMTVRTREELIADTFAPIDQMFSVARAIQLAALLVAALAIANTMFISVLERRWEVGLQRAVGMDGGSVKRTLLSEAGAIGLIGSLGAWMIGLIIGYLMVGDMERAYYFSFPFEIPVDLMAVTLAVGGAISLVAGAYPSRAALRTPIVEALRYE